MRQARLAAQHDAFRFKRVVTSKAERRALAGQAPAVFLGVMRIVDAPQTTRSHMSMVRGRSETRITRCARKEGLLRCVIRIAKWSAGRKESTARGGDRANRYAISPASCSKTHLVLHLAEHHSSAPSTGLTNFAVGAAVGIGVAAAVVTARILRIAGLG